jgi:hypothetical protein
MIILGFTAPHTKDSLPVQAGWALTRLAQTGRFKKVTHTESVLAGNNYKLCTIASSSARDGGVRIKKDIALTKGNWIALDVPEFKIQSVEGWFNEKLSSGYDWLGAAGTRLYILHGLPYSVGRYFCNEACGESAKPIFKHQADELTPSDFFEVLVKYAL